MRHREGADGLDQRPTADVIVGFRDVYHEKKDSMTLAQKIDALRRFADDVIASP